MASNDVMSLPVISTTSVDGSAVSETSPLLPKPEAPTLTRAELEKGNETEHTTLSTDDYSMIPRPVTNGIPPQNDQPSNEMAFQRYGGTDGSNLRKANIQLPSTKEEEPGSGSVVTAGTQTHDTDHHARDNSNTISTAVDKKVFATLWANHKKIVLCLAAVIATIIVVNVLYNAPLWTHGLQAHTYNTTTTVGDDASDSSTLLITLNSSTASATVSISDPATDSVSGTVYKSHNPPSKTYETLPPVAIPILTGKALFNYNYNSADIPLYLNPGSMLMYIMTILSSGTSDCPARLFLFKNKTNYFNFRDEKEFQSFDASPCLIADETNIFTSWSFNITEPASFYVGIDIDADTTVNSTVTAHSISYNTTGLTSQPDCGYLTLSDPVCTISTCRNRVFCWNSGDRYFILKVTGYVSVSIIPTTARVYGASRTVGFAFVLVFGVLSIIIVVAIGCCCCWKQCKKRKEGSNV